MHIETTRFGLLSVDRNALITFEDGLLGFEELRRFVAVPHGPDTPFVWLQSAERPDLAFLLLPPAYVFPGYPPGYPPDVPPGAALWVIVTVPPSRPHDMTANLLGPLVVEPETGRGRQIVLDGERFSTKHRVFPAVEPARAAAVGGG